MTRGCTGSGIAGGRLAKSRIVSGETSSEVTLAKSVIPARGRVFATKCPANLVEIPQLLICNSLLEPSSQNLIRGIEVKMIRHENFS
jgi:hypothetical protein